MNISATVPSSIKVTRSRLVGLLAGVAAFAVVITWAIVTVFIDESTDPSPISRPTISWDGAIGRTWESSTGWGFTLPLIASPDPAGTGR